VIDGVRSLIGSVYPIPPVSDTLYHDYKITRTGSEVVAYVDGVEYHRVSDDALNAEGKIGLGSHNNTVFFDDFSDGNPGETGLNQDGLNKVSVYPNPAKTSFIISSDETLNSFKLVNILGKTVLNSKGISSTRVSVDLSDIPSGMYFIVAEMQNGTSGTSKIIIE
jgi:beta-glucanase (GH16 family)